MECSNGVPKVRADGAGKGAGPRRLQHTLSSSARCRGIEMDLNFIHGKCQAINWFGEQIFYLAVFKGVFQFKIALGRNRALGNGKISCPE